MKPQNKITILLILTLILCISAIGSASATDTGNNTTGPSVTANLTGGTYNTTQNVALATNDSSATIYYTNDTTDPRNSTTRITYTTPITINMTTTLRYAAMTPNGEWSILYIQNYQIGNGTVTDNTYQSNYSGPQTNSTKWTYDTGSAINSPAIGPDGTIYIVTYYPGYTGTYFYALNPDGTLKWTYNPNNPITSPPIVGTGGTIYFGCADGKIYALNPNGTLKWTYTVGKSVTSITLGSDGTIYFGVKTMLSSLIDNETQALPKWNYSTIDVPSPITIGSDGTIYFGDGYYLNALNTDGTLKWRYRETMGQFIAAITTGRDGTVYMVYGTYGSNLVALTDNGTNYIIKWQSPNIYSDTSSLAISSDGTIYWLIQNSRIVLNQNTIYAITDNGTNYITKWTYNLSNYLDAPAIIGSDGTLYFGSNDNNIYALNSNGTLKWNYTTGNAIQGGFAIGSDGTLYTGNINGILYALKDVIANFTTNTTNGTAPLTVQFNDTSTNATNWNWDFGDGTTSTEQNPTHTYNTPGTYTIKLTVTGPGGSDEKIIENCIKVGNIISDFTTNTTNGTAPLTVQFNDTSTNATNWNWDFGDGTTSTEQNPTHTYNTPGTYTIKLTVTGPGGSDEKIKTNYINVYVPTVASFTANQTTGISPLAIQFKNTSPSYTFSWLWDFGDGTTSREENPIHVYHNPGNSTVSYTVKLTVTGLRNGTDEEIKTNYITVTPLIEIVTSNPNGGTYNSTQTVTLTVKNSTNTIYYTTDGTDPTNSSTRITYTTPITINTTTTLRYAAQDPTGNWSPLYIQNYVIATNGGTYSPGNYTGPVTNATNWTYSFDGTPSSIVTGPDGTIYMGVWTDGGSEGISSSGYLYAFDTNGTLKWKFYTGAGDIIIGKDGTIYIGGGIQNTYTLTALNTNGTTKWNFTAGFNRYFRGYTLGADGTLYLAVANLNEVLAFNPDGTTKWTYGVSWPTCPTIGSDGTIYFGDLGQDFWAVNPDGTLKWYYHLNTVYGGFGRGILIGSDGILYFTDSEEYGNYGHIYALNPDGTLKSYLDNLPSAVGSNGTVYFSTGNTVYALASNGTVLWTFSDPNPDSGCTGITVGSDGTIYFGETNALLINSTTQSYYIGDSDNIFYALNPDGTIKWKYNANNTISSYIVGTDGSIYLTTGYYILTYPNRGLYNGNTIYVLDSNGTLKWNYSTNKSISSYTLNNGTLYISCTDNKLYTIKDPVPSADFTTNTTNANTSQSIQFTDNSTGSPTTWTWDFGDGTTSTEQNPTHTYNTPGTYTIKLTVTGPGGSDEKIKTNHITINIPDTTSPTASANVKSGTYNTNKAVTLSMSENGTIYYTTDGTTPTTNSKKYTGPITISSTTTLRYIAVDLAGNTSPIYTTKYVIDKVAPTVKSTNPKNGATGVARSTSRTITITFSKNIKLYNKSLWSKIYIKNSKGQKVSISKYISGNKLTIKINTKKAANTWYTVYIPAGAISDSVGNKLKKAYTFKFKTGRY